MTADETAVLTERTPPPMVPSGSAFDGLTALDFFAAHALCGLLAFTTGGEDGCGQLDPKEAAKDAYAMASAMIARRNAPPT